MTAIAIIPEAKLCVASLIAPSRYGPTNPPVFATALTSAIDAAAPTPAILDVASAQNGPNIDATPSTAIDNVTTDHVMPLPIDASTSPEALTSAAISTCQRRSPVRSEWRPTMTIV